MMHPLANRPMLLCGQTLGYVTAYDLPEFRPRGSFVCKQSSDVKAIVDAKAGGLFMTAGLHGDIQVWKWGEAAQGVPQQAANPFAPAGAGAAAAAANPFAPAGGAAPAAGCGVGGCGGPGDLMMG